MLWYEHAHGLSHTPRQLSGFKLFWFLCLLELGGNQEDGEITQRLITPVVPVENLSLLPSTHIGWLSTNCNSRSIYPWETDAWCFLSELPVACLGQVWWYTITILAPGCLSRGEANLACAVRPCLKKQARERWRANLLLDLIDFTYNFNPGVPVPVHGYMECLLSRTNSVGVHPVVLGPAVH